MSKRQSSSGVGQLTLYDFLKKKRGAFSEGNISGTTSDVTVDGFTSTDESFVTCTHSVSTSVSGEDLEKEELDALCEEPDVLCEEPDVLCEEPDVSCEEFQVQLPAANITSQKQIFSGPPSDISSSSNQRPIQPNPMTFRYPLKKMGQQNHSFNSKWFNTYSWLEYSIERDAAFCFPCRHFNAKGGKNEDVFTKDGFTDWKHAAGKNGILQGHAGCHSHIIAMQSWKQYDKNKRLNISIENRLDPIRSKQICNNRHYLRSIAQTLLLIGQLEIALRGHDESKSSLNRGNFLMIFSAIASHDSIIQEYIDKGPKNATYLSPEIQNSILQIMGDKIRGTICEQVQQSGYFSLMADETKDMSKQEQLSVVVRYVNREGIINERFLTFFQATKLDAESLSSYLVKILEDNGLDPARIVSQGYDGASVMSGHLTGVQQRIKEKCPSAIYIHCCAHILNLVLVDCSKKVQLAHDFFCLLESLYVFMVASKAHSMFIATQKELHPDKPTHELQRLSDTRWACRHDAVNAICYTYDSLLSTLEDISDGPDRAKAVEAQGLLLQIKDFKFLISLIIFDRILTCTKGLSDSLQSSHIDLGKAADLVLATESTLQDFRTDSEWEKVFTYAKRVAEVNNVVISTVNSRSRRQRQLPRRFEDGVICESTGSREIMSSSQHYKVNVYFPVLDSILSELKSRFNHSNIEIMKAISSINPQSKNFLDPSTLKPLASVYNLDYNCLSMEVILAKKTLANYELKKVNDFFLELLPLKNAFPTLLKLVQISMTIAVTTAHCERSFSALKRIKTYLRTSMSEQRLQNLSILAIENELASELSLDAVVDTFASEDKNRRILLK